MNSISASAVSAFYSSGLQIQNAQFLKNRIALSESLAGQPPTANMGKVAVRDTLAGEALSVKLVPRLMDVLA